MEKKLLAALAIAIAATAAFAAGNDETARREQAARETASAFLGELGATLKRELAQGGPAAAIDVCSEVAPQIAGRLSRETGARVTRVSSKVRNPLLGTPDAWEQKVLQQFERRAAKREGYENMTFSEVVTEPDGKYFRFMKAIGTQELCLTCHGNAQQVQAAAPALKARYPMDRATGYKPGDLRGALSIKQPLDRDPVGKRD